MLFTSSYPALHKLLCSRPPKKYDQSGQMAVIVLLIMVIILVVATQLAQQTVKDVEISTENTETTRVFNAAESTAEEALARLDANNGVIPDLDEINNPENSNYFADRFNAAAEAGSQINTSAQIIPQNDFDSFVPIGKSVTLDPGTSSEATIRWGQAGADTAGLLVAIFERESAVSNKINVRYVALAPYNIASRGDNFVVATSTPPGNLYRSQSVITFSNTLTEAIRIMPVYSNTHLFVSGLNAVQSHTIQGTATDTVANQSRTIELVRGLKAAPSAMGYAVYSGSTLTKPSP